MVNPFRSEEEAFRFLIRTIAYFAAIVLATALGGRWAGLAVFAALTLGILGTLFLRHDRQAPVRRHAVSQAAAGERRILVIANETVAGKTLLETIRTRAEGYREQVLVITPALNSPLRHWASDEDGARAAAQQRLERSLRALREAGVDANGEVGDAEPVQAIEDWLHMFGADEVIISTHPAGRSNWLEKGVVERARERFDVPITHVVVDLEAERREVREAS